MLRSLSDLRLVIVPLVAGIPLVLFVWDGTIHLGAIQGLKEVRSVSKLEVRSLEQNMPRHALARRLGMGFFSDSGAKP